jgi:hypothetical protein
VHEFVSKTGNTVQITIRKWNKPEINYVINLITQANTHKRTGDRTCLLGNSKERGNISSLTSRYTTLRSHTPRSYAALIHITSNKFMQPTCTLHPHRKVNICFLFYFPSSSLFLTFLHVVLVFLPVSFLSSFVSLFISFTIVN